MKTPNLVQFVSVLAVVPMLLSAQPLRDAVPLRHWPAPLYWQPDLAALRPLATTSTDPNPLTFISTTPCRLVDTRVGFGFSGAFGPPALVGGVSRTFPMQSSSTCSIPATAQAYSLNITVVPHGPLDYLTAYPTGQPQPVVSTLNSLQGFIVANAAIVPVGTSGSIDIFVSNATDLIIDINGYYAASFGTPSGGYQFPNVSGTPLMTIAPSGNVGVGTATPGSALDVAGDINFSGGLRFQNTPIFTVLPNPPTGPNSIGPSSLGIGPLALSSNTTGAGNTAVGPGFPPAPGLPFAPLGSNTSGNNNTAIGLLALGQNTTGSYNTAAGWLALENNTSGYGNTGLGSGALEFSTAANFNTAVGEFALAFNTSGTSNTADGDHAIFNNTTGGLNTAVGYNALGTNTTGSNNIAVGQNAAVNVSAGNGNNIHIGSQGLSGDSATIRIGTPGTHSSLYVAGVTSNALTNGAPLVWDTMTQQMGYTSSSRRYKDDIQDMGNASAGLMRLRPVTFRYQKPLADGSKPIQYGLIAEEVAEVYPDLVAYSADGQVETVKYQVLDSMLLNEVQRQEKLVDEQKSEIGVQKDQIRAQNEQIHALEERLARLEVLIAAASR